ncbi:hypothetical protein ACLOJK_034991 [Asimina triloba]
MAAMVGRPIFHVAGHLFSPNRRHPHQQPRDHPWQSVDSNGSNLHQRRDRTSRFHGSGNQETHLTADLAPATTPIDIPADLGSDPIRTQTQIHRPAPPSSGQSHLAIGIISIPPSPMASTDRPMPDLDQPGCRTHHAPATTDSNEPTGDQQQIQMMASNQLPTKIGAEQMLKQHLQPPQIAARNFRKNPNQSQIPSANRNRVSLKHAIKRKYQSSKAASTSATALTWKS